MLIEKSVDVNDIATIKLVTAEEIVAKITAIDSATVTISKPLVVNVSFDERTGRPGLQMAPFFLLGANPDSKITLQRIHLLAMVPSNEDIKKNYIQMTSSLAVPGVNDAGLIV